MVQPAHKLSGNTNANYSLFLSSDRWKELSRQRKEIDKYACVCCGCKDNLNVHHLFYPANWNDTSIDMLVTVCHSCHTLLHRIQEQYDKSIYDAKAIYRNMHNNEEMPAVDYSSRKEYWYQHYEEAAIRLCALRCWELNLFSSNEAFAYIDQINGIMEKDKSRFLYRIHKGKCMELIAFAKDCVILNAHPQFDKSRRKYKTKAKTRFT